MRSLGRLAWTTAVAGSDPRGAAREIFYAALAVVPGADPAYERWRHPDLYAVPADPRAIVIDGYPGSGNTWTTHVVMAICRDSRPLAHHRHRAAQILEGARRGLATALVVRDPVDAIASAVVRHGGTFRVELCRYDYFHTRCWSVAPRVEVMTFEQATRSAPSIIDRLNYRFGCGITPLREFGDDAEDRIRGLLEWNGRLDFGDAARTRTAAPSADRSDLLRQAREQLLAPQNARALARCRAHYARYRELAERQAAAAAE